MKHYLSLPITEDISFVQPRLQHAEELFQLIDSDRKKLSEFLDFLEATTSIEDEVNFLKMKLTGMANGTDCLFLIYYQGKLAGTIDLHFIDEKNKKAEIGYLIHSQFSCKNINTLAVKKMTEIAFEALGLNKLTIVADCENIGSNKVAEKAGFHFVATFKEDQMLHGKLKDMNRYALLKSDFMAKK